MLADFDIPFHKPLSLAKTHHFRLAFKHSHSLRVSEIEKEEVGIDYKSGNIYIFRVTDLQ